MSDGSKRQKIRVNSKSSAKAKNTEREKSNTKELPLKTSDRDAIISISAIILLLACSIVIGNAVYDNTLAHYSQPEIKYGDNVGIEYVGSLRTHYDRDGSPVIFDTNILSLANDKNRDFIYEQCENSNKYGTHNIVIGSGEFLTTFENAIVGHHSGDIIELAIDAKDAYPPDGKIGFLKKNYDYSIDKVKIFYSDTDFKSFFGVDAPETCFTVKSPYGWNANVVRNFNGLIEVDYLPENSQVYDSGTGVIYKVSKVDSGKIMFQYDFSYDDRIIKAIGPDNEETIYIIEEVSNGECKYKTEHGANTIIAGEPLYFTIKIVNLK